MDEVIVIEDRVDMQCVRHVHLMSNGQDFALTPTPLPLGEGTSTREAGVWHWRWEGPFRGALDIETEGGVKFRRFMAWSMEGCESVREALGLAAAEYERLFGGRPQFGFMKSLPRGVEPFTEFEGMLLLDAEWMLERCVAVGGRRQKAEG